MQKVNHIIIIIVLLNVYGVFSTITYSRIFVFGDSFSSTSKTWELTNQSWPISPPNYQGRFSNGKIWVDYLQELLDIPIESLAYGGATTNNSFVQGYTGAYANISVPSVSDQIYQLFSRTNLTLILDPFAVFVVEGGANDFYYSPNVNGSEVAISTVSNMETLYALGVRRFFIPNIGPLYLQPYYLHLNVDVLVNSIQEHNVALVSNIRAFRRRHPDANVVEWNLVDAFSQIYTKPFLYGYLNIDSPCINSTSYYNVSQYTLCTLPNTYIFWDQFHFTSSVHNLLAQNAFRRLQQAGEDSIIQVSHDDGVTEANVVLGLNLAGAFIVSVIAMVYLNISLRQKLKEFSERLPIPNI